MKAGFAGPTPERLRLAEQVATLRGDGLTHQQVADALGISRSYASALCGDPTGSRARARKDGYAAPCVDCGGATSGSEGRRAEPRCQRCAAVKSGTEKTVWTRERIIAAIQWWANLHGEPPAMPDFCPTFARETLGDTAREARAQRYIKRGQIPWFTSVIRCFGSWNAGLEAAGFETRQAGGGANSQRRRTNPRQPW